MDKTELFERTNPAKALAVMGIVLKLAVQKTARG